MIFCGFPQNFCNCLTTFDCFHFFCNHSKNYSPVAPKPSAIALLFVIESLRKLYIFIVTPTLAVVMASVGQKNKIFEELTMMMMMLMVMRMVRRSSNQCEQVGRRQRQKGSSSHLPNRHHCHHRHRHQHRHRHHYNFHQLYAFRLQFNSHFQQGLNWV